MVMIEFNLLETKSIWNSGELKYGGKVVQNIGISGRYGSGAGGSEKWGGVGGGDFHCIIFYYASTGEEVNLCLYVTMELAMLLLWSPLYSSLSMVNSRRVTTQKMVFHSRIGVLMTRLDPYIPCVMGPYGRLLYWCIGKLGCLVRLVS